MKNFYFRIISLFLFLFILNGNTLLIASSPTDYFRSKATGNWSTPASWESSTDGSTNWQTATISPGNQAALITIQNPHHISVDLNSQGASSIIIQSGGFLIISENKNLLVFGNLTINGFFISDYGILQFVGTGDQLINSSSSLQTLYDLVVDKSTGTLSLGTNITELNLDNFTMTNGNFITPATLNVTGDLIVNGGTFTSGANIYINGDWTNNGGTFIPGSGTVIFQAYSGQAPKGQMINGTVSNQAFNNLDVDTEGSTLSVGGSTTTLTVNNFTLTSGNFTAPPALNINGNTLLTAGTFTAGANTINIQGNWTNNGGLFTPGTGTIKFIGTSAQSIGGNASTTFNNLTVTNSIGAITVTTNINIGGALYMNGTATLLIPNTVVVINESGEAGILTGSGTVNVTKTGNPIGNIGGFIYQYKFSQYTLTDLTVNYSANAGNQFISALTYGKLKLANASGVNNTIGNITAEELTTISDGIFNMSTYQLIANSVNHEGILKTQNVSSSPIPVDKTWGGTVEYYGATQDVAAGTYATLNITAVGTKTASGNISTTNLDNGGGSNVASILDMAGYTLAGTINNTGATIRFNGASNGLAVGTGTVEYYGATQDVAAGTYATLNITAVGTKTASGNISTTNLDNGGGSNVASILDMAGYTLAGTINNTGATIKFSGASNGIAISSGTVEYYAVSGGQTIKSGTYNTLKLSNTSGLDTADGEINTTTFNTTAGGTMEMVTYPLTATTVDHHGILQTQCSQNPSLPIGKNWDGTVIYSGETQFVANGTYNDLILTGIDTKTINGTNTTINGILSMEGTAIVAGSTPIYGPNSTLQYKGLTAQTTGLEFPDSFIGAGGVIIDNLDNVSLNDDKIFETLLTLQNGKVILGNYNLTLGSEAVGGTLSSSNMIVTNGSGECQRKFTQNDSYTFPVGDTTNGDNYSPMTLNFSSGTYSPSANAAVRVTDAKHPNNASSTNYLTRYWTISQSGITSFSCDISGEFPNEDVNGTTSAMITGKWDGSKPWEKHNPVSANNISATVESLSDFTGITEAAPTVTITADPDSTVCKDVFLTLTANSEGDLPFIYLWNPGDYTTQSITPSTASIGTTIYSVIVTDGNGFTVKDSITVTVVVPEAPIGESFQEFCDAATINDLTAIGTNIIWYNTSTGGNPLEPTTPLEDDSNYFASQTIGGCESEERFEVTVNINLLPTSTVSGGGTVCEDETLPNVEIALTGVSPWDVIYSDGTSSDTLSVTISPYIISNAPAGTYTVTEVCDVNCTGISMNGSATVIVNVRPTVYVSGGGVICDGDTCEVKFHLTGTQPWDITYTDGTNFYEEPEITVNPYIITKGTEGTYVVSEISDANCTGVSMIGSATVTVNPLPTFQIEGSTELCKNMKNVEYTISNQNNFIIGNAIFDWKCFHADTIITQTPKSFINWDILQYTFNKDTLTLYITNNETKCVSKKDTVFINFSNYLAPEPLSLIVKKENERPFLLIHPDTSDNYFYLWSINNSYYTDEIKRYLYLTPFEPMLESLLDNSNIDSIPINVKVTPKGQIPEKCGNNSIPFYYKNSKLFKFGKDDLFIIFPNPASIEINLIINEEVSGTNYENTQLRIINSTGEALFEREITTWETTIPVNGLQSGLYFVEVSNNGRNKQVKKIVIQ
jgi:hypothetical protein